MEKRYVSHPVYGKGVTQYVQAHARYTTVRFEKGLVVTLPSSDLTSIETDPFMAGDRVAWDHRQGTVKGVDPTYVNVAWDNDMESYVVPALTDLTLLPPLSSGTPVKHKGTTHVGKIINTPIRGDTHVCILWNSGHSSTVKLDTLAPTRPQEPLESKRTVDAVLAEIEEEIRQWREKECEASTKVEALTDRLNFLRNAKQHVELVQSIEKW